VNAAVGFVGFDIEAGMLVEVHDRPHFSFYGLKRIAYQLLCNLIILSQIGISY
jgi:predicted ATP-grasp superfamily ATP-dependent carboligase